MHLIKAHTTARPNGHCGPSLWDGRIIFSAGSDSGGQRAAAIYSPLGTAKLNGLDPEFYLRQVLTRIAEHPIKNIEQLLPWNLADAIQPSAKAA